MKEKLQDYKEKSLAKEEDLQVKKMEANRTVEIIAERRRLRSEENKINLYNMKLTKLHKHYKVFEKHSTKA